MSAAGSEMRPFIGHLMKVLADNFPGPVEGIMIEDKPNMILLKGKDGKVVRVVKSHISGFVPMDSEPTDYIAMHMLFCENKGKSCLGVKYIKEGSGVAAKDYEEFMGPCPCRGDDCSYGTKGELRSVSGKVLRDALAGTMYGDYQEQKEEVQSGDNDSGEAPDSEGAGDTGV
jgi:hypothetical protein